MKSKQELIEKWESAIGAAEFYGRGKEDRLIEYMRNFVDDLNRLDEPEVLSQEWLDENKSSWTKLKIDGYYIPVEKLQNLLVPKQELPVIPKFVADYIEEGHELGVDLGTALTIETDHLNDIKKYIRDNEETFARAWLAYPNVEVEEEQKYYALIKGHENIYSGICFWIYDTEIEELLIDNAEIYPDVTAEYMIKATKDEWANLGINDDNADFVKVEELEE